MAQYEKRDNSGILFRNERKQDPKHADYQGSATINGVDYWMNGWIKEGKKGKFMSFSFKQKQPQLRVVEGGSRGGADFDDDLNIPF